MKEQFVEYNCKYKEAFNNSLTPMIIIDAETGNIDDANLAACDYYLYSKKELLSMNISDINISTQKEISKEIEKAELENRKFFRFRHKLFDGEIRDVEVSSSFIEVGDKNLLFSVIHDIKEKTKLEKDYMINQIYFDNLFNNSPEAIAIVNAEFRILNINDKFKKAFQYDLLEIVNKDITKILCEQTIYDPFCDFRESIIEGKCIRREVRIKRRDDSTLDLLLFICPIVVDRNFIGAYFIYSDISETKEKENKIKMLTYNDSLTGLFNMKFFLDNLDYEVFKNNSNENTKEKLVILILKVNEFKEIKNALGHFAGEQVLKEFALRLRASVGIEDTVARFSEDEFAILMPRIDTLYEVERLSNNIIKNLEDYFSVGNGEFQITTCIGIAVYPDDGMDSTTLIRKADIAMSKCKIQNNNNATRFEKSLDKEIQEYFWIKNDLLKLGLKEELYLDYQPIYSIDTNRLVGAEALIRWNHGEKGIIPPARFIPIAEKIGMIHPIGEWVLLKACSQNKEWQELGYDPIYISVNVSVLQLEKPDFTKRIKKILEKSMLKPQYLQLEITETFFTQNYELIQDTIKELGKLGIKIAIDDFGTGYSSLGQLCELNINNIKIDRMFIDGVDGNINKSKIVKGIISLAESLNITLTAEGVEREEELKFLNANRCTFVQGYLFSKPVEAYKIEELLKRNGKNKICLC
ncbi:EAL domain-containing protein [Tissierella carlieri]|uniref:EAL domain-containing protein n=1 Tax=Tissierella carlieri TaxID=689904 RepID=UPI001C0FC2D5|nr:EAL domain-containing protein [Tissierella carlieri]MBU5312969.1 EAL domain-containing protein [Tissierella carlieri]